MLALAREPMEPLDEAALVRRARQGDLVAYEALYRVHAGRVYAVCLRLAGDAARAEDLTQRAFVRAWQRLSSFREEAAFGTWLHRLAVNLALDELRAEQRRAERTAEAGEVYALSEARRTGPERGMDLERAIAQLPDRARAVLVLHDIEGWKHADIARHLGVTTGTTKSQLHRARRLLREALRS